MSVPNKSYLTQTTSKRDNKQSTQYYYQLRHENYATISFNAQMKMVDIYAGEANIVPR